MVLCVFLCCACVLFMQIAGRCEQLASHLVVQKDGERDSDVYVVGERAL